MNCYLEIEGTAIDEDGNPCAAGVKLDLPFESEPENVFRFISSILNIEDGERTHLITKEEYEEKYGDDEE